MYIGTCILYKYMYMHIGACILHKYMYKYMYSDACSQHSVMCVVHTSQDDALEETGWKLVHGDVFRPPRYPTLMVACVGSGIQLFCMVLIVLRKSV